MSTAIQDLEFNPSNVFIVSAAPVSTKSSQTRFNKCRGTDAGVLCAEYPSCRKLLMPNTIQYTRQWPDTKWPKTVREHFPQQFIYYTIELDFQQQFAYYVIKLDRPWRLLLISMQMGDDRRDLKRR